MPPKDVTEYKKKIFGKLGVVSLRRNGLLMRTSGSASEEVTGDWGELNSEGFHILHSSQNIVTVMKQMRVSGEVCVAPVG
jgi:hypothetical protein